MYNIYSYAKIATVVAGAQLLERGDFLLNEPLYAYIPEFKHMYVKDTTGNLKEAENPITIGDFFSMTAGFTYDFNSHGFQKARELTKGKMDTVEIIKCVAADPLSFEPGSHWQYSICHDVLAALVSVISGKKFRNYVKDNIFDPLEMNESVYHQTKKLWSEQLNNTVLYQMKKQYRVLWNRRCTAMRVPVFSETKGSKTSIFSEKNMTAAVQELSQLYQIMQSLWLLWQITGPA